MRDPPGALCDVCGGDEGGQEYHVIVGILYHVLLALSGVMEEVWVACCSGSVEGAEEMLWGRT